MPDQTGAPEKKNDLEKMGLPMPLGSGFKSAEKLQTLSTEQPSNVATERIIESKPEEKVETPDVAVKKATEAPAMSVAAPAVVPAKDELTEKIEDILTEDLADVFVKMTPAQQREFKIKGEETAGKIKKLLSGAKVKLQKIIKLLMGWMRLIPGVNRFYLEQEAKIKADKLIHLKEGSVYDNYNEKI